MKFILVSLLLLAIPVYAESASPTPDKNEWDAFPEAPAAPQQETQTPPAMPLSDQEHYAQLMHAKQLLDQMSVQLNATIADKENHCMKAIGNEEFCGCFARNAPSNVSFTKYVEFFGFGPDEFDYQKLSPAAKTLYENVRKTRDKCVNWKGKQTH